MQTLLNSAVARSFNRITVDGEMSTNDSVLFLASGASGVRPPAPTSSWSARRSRRCSLRVALMMVADGEGATKIMRLRVEGAESEARRGAGGPGHRRLPAGEDGHARRRPQLGKGHQLGGRRDGGPVAAQRDAASVRRAGRRERGGVPGLRRRPHEDDGRGAGSPRSTSISIWASGSASAELFFADMGHEYITINAEYHT